MKQLLDQIAARSKANTIKWGSQGFVTLGLAAVEECGELAQAILQHEYEQGEQSRIYEEALDLAALCHQTLNLFYWETPPNNQIEKIVSLMLSSKVTTDIQILCLSISQTVGVLSAEILEVRCNGAKADLIKAITATLAAQCLIVLKTTAPSDAKEG